MRDCAVGWCATDTRPAARLRTGVVCRPCARAWRDLVVGLVDALDWLGASMVRYASPAGAGSGPVSGSPEAPMPLRAEMADQRTEITAALREWALDAAGWQLPVFAGCGHAAGGMRVAGPAHNSPAVVAGWLVSRLEWLALWPGYPRMAEAFSRALGGAYGLAPWGRTRRDLPVPCTACGLAAVSQYGGDDWIRCRSCGHRVPWWRYEQWVRRALREAAVRDDVGGTAAATAGGAA